MTLTVEVTKKSVSEIMPKAWNITLQVELFEDAVSVFVQDISQAYKQGKAISIVEDAFIADIQKAVDKYESEQDIFTHPNLDISVSTIQAAIVV